MKNQFKIFAVISLFFFLLALIDVKHIPISSTPAAVPQSDLFSGLPIQYEGETASANGYEIQLNKVAIEGNTLRLDLRLVNETENEINLFLSLKLYSLDNHVLTATNIASTDTLQPTSSMNVVVEYELPAMVETRNELRIYRLIYMPRGYSDALFAFAMTTRPETITPPPTEQLQPRAVYGSTGDPWKMLVLIYPNIDINYVDLDGQTKHLTASMPSQDLTNMQNAFLNLPHRDIVYGYSDTSAELEATIVVVNRPLTSLSHIYNGYWPSPDITRPELDQYAPKGKFDSVIVLWQASHPVTGQSIPDGGGWGWGYWPGETYANGMTYASVYNLSWVWTTSNQACHGEVFLHEWLHGVTGFYGSKGVPFNLDDLHGAEEAGYGWDIQDGCWDSWLRDYMRGLVYENGQRKALVPELSWYKGSITTWSVQGWRGEYYNNETLSGIPVMVRDDPSLNFFWELSSPHPLVNPDHFSARWTRNMSFAAGQYRFDATRDDGLRIWVDNVLILDKWIWGYTNESVDYYMTGGSHVIRVEMYEIDGWASTILNIIPLAPSTQSTSILSAGKYDGYILEYSENASTGRSLNATSTTLFVGDDSMDRQYRSILHFDTSGLPDSAVVTRATLKIKLSKMVGTNPFGTHGSLLADLISGPFGGNSILSTSDFQALPSISGLGTMISTPSNGWYSMELLSPPINLFGVTQIRLRFALDDNDDRGADYLAFFSGNATVSTRPVLTIEYYVP